MTAFDKKINQIATRHRWNIEKQARAAVPCYIIAAPTYEDLLLRRSRFGWCSYPQNSRPDTLIFRCELSCYPPPESKSTVTSWPTRCSGELEQYHPNYIPLLLAEIPVSNIRFPLTFSILSCADGRDRTDLSAQSNMGAVLLHCASA